jgi:fumarate reductase subunit C
MGYTMEVMRGKKPAPPLENWWKLFVDGLKLFVVGIIYALPVILLAIVLIGGSVLLLMNPETLMEGLGTMFAGLIVIIVIAVLISLISTMGNVRLSRTNSMAEAFNFGAIFERIGRIGWGSYFISLLIMYIIIGVVVVAIALIPFIGGLINLILAPAYSIFTSRYITQIYDSVPETT